jgi:hypothetical protein
MLKPTTKSKIAAEDISQNPQPTTHNSKPKTSLEDISLNSTPNNPIPVHNPIPLIHKPKPLVRKISTLKFLK